MEKVRSPIKIKSNKNDEEEKIINHQSKLNFNELLNLGQNVIVTLLGKMKLSSINQILWIRGIKIE